MVACCSKTSAFYPFEFYHLLSNAGLTGGSSRGIIPRAVEDIFYEIENDPELTRCTGSQTYHASSLVSTMQHDCAENYTRLDTHKQ